MAAYRGLVGAYAFAFRHSPSWLFRSYVLVSGLLGGFVLVLLAFALVQWLANPTGVLGERALLGVIGIALLAPLFAPVLVVARRYRLEAGATGDRALAAAGYVFVLSVYLGLVIADPTAHGGALGVLDTLPAAYGAVPTLGAVGGIALAARLTRPPGS